MSINYQIFDTKIIIIIDISIIFGFA